MSARESASSIEPGEFVGLIGESGSGKTTLGMALLRLLERPGRIAGGNISFNGTDITAMNQDELREFRWTDIATVFQSSMNSLNPVVRVEGQFRDVIEYHTELRGNAVLERIKTLFDMVFIDHKFITAYPHELSGGMKQRVNLALALAIEPQFVLLDEPDHRTRRGRPGQHLGERPQTADRARVRRAVHQPRHRHRARPVRPDLGHVCREDRRGAKRPTFCCTTRCTRTRRDCSARTATRPTRRCASPTSPVGRRTWRTDPSAVSFAPRCPEKIERCLTIEPPLEAVGGGRVACHVAKIQRSDGVTAPTRSVRSPRVFVGPQFVKSASESEVALGRERLLTVDDVSKTFVPTPEGLGVTWERGGEERQLRVAPGRGDRAGGAERQREVDPGQDDHRRRPPDGGHDHLPREEWRPRGRRDVAADGCATTAASCKLCLQDPYSSLNPAKTLGYILSRPLINYKGLRGAAVREKVMELLETVALTPASRYYNRFASLSGGQRQRVVIARALAVEPGADRPPTSPSPVSTSRSGPRCSNC